jgi:hypothetical protein
MMYMLGPILDDGDDFYQMAETRKKRVEEYKWQIKERLSSKTKPDKTA